MIGCCCCWVGCVCWVCLKFLVNGFVFVGMGCICCWVGCCGVWDWKGELDVGVVNGCVFCGEEWVKGLVDWFVMGCCWGEVIFWIGCCCVKGEFVCCWFMSMDWWKGLVFCWGVWRFFWKVGVFVWKFVMVFCCIGVRELGWKLIWGCGENLLKLILVKVCCIGCVVCCGENVGCFCCWKGIFVWNWWMGEVINLFWGNCCCCWRGCWGWNGVGF